jgi:tetratricopeptide (TPR) repeat protein
MDDSRPPLPDSYEGLYRRARELYSTGDVEDAVGLYRRLADKLARLTDRVLDRRPQLREMHQQARLELTALLHMEGRYAEAIEVEEVLLKTHPDEADSWHRDLAVLRIAKGEVEAGMAELRVLAEKTPDETTGWMVLGREARIEGRFTESQSAFERALEAADESETEVRAEIHYQRFVLYQEMGQLDDALAAWEEAVRLNSELSRTVRRVYTMLSDAGRYTDAERYIARDENAMQAGLQRGLIASMTGNLSEARQEWRQVADLDPDEADYGHDAWVEAVLRLGDPEPALEWLQDALERQYSPRLLVLAGIGWAMRADRELAAELFQRAINLLRRQRPPKKKLDSADWRLLDSQVTNEEVRAALKTYFAVVETLWG